MPRRQVVYVIVDTPEHSRVIQAGQPPTTLAAYRLEIEGKQDDGVAAFVASQAFPPRTRFGVVSESALKSHVLAPRLEAAKLNPGEPDE